MDVKEKIVCGAQKMFTKFGVRGITMDMIAEDLGMSKRTIYENFKDKDELVKCCIESAMESTRQTISDIIENSVNIIEAMIRILKHNVNILKTINPLFFRDINKYYPELNENKLKDHDKNNIKQFITLLERGVKEKLFRKEINTSIVAILLMEQFKLLNNEEVFSEEKFSRAEVFENIVMNFMRGIATQEGLAMIEKFDI